MSIMDQAKAELERAKFGEEDSIVMLGLLKQFLRQWDSGGAVAVASQVFNRLLAGQPLSPLTGTEDEWIDRSEMAQKPTWQNARCVSVFRERRGGKFVYYDNDLPTPAGEDRAYITMPYDPATRMVRMPVFDFNTAAGNGSLGAAENPVDLPFVGE